MNDQLDFEFRVASHLADEGVAPPSDAFYDDLISRASDSRQRPRWLALIKESPMRTSQGMAVGSPMARVAAIAVATLLLATLLVGAGIAGARLLAADAALIVAQDGSGDFTTISDAVAVAEDGDTVEIRPGTYVEAIAIDKDITLAGDGPVEEIIIQAPADGPTVSAGDEVAATSLPAPYALLIEQSDATVSGLTFEGPSSRVQAIGGAPVLEGLVFVGVGDAKLDNAGSLLVSGGSSATVRESLFDGGIGIAVSDRSEPLIDGNVLRSGASIGADIGDGGIIRNNDISGADGPLGLRTPTMALIEDNIIAGGVTCIYLDQAAEEGAGPRIRANSISDCHTGISVNAGSAPLIEENMLEANDVGISLTDGAGTASLVGNELTDNDIAIGISASDARIEGNTIKGGTTGIVASRGATASIADNTITGASNRGVTIAADASPTLSGNRICDNGANVVVADGAEPVMQDNEICPDPATSEEG
jgi:nitrous oxidase accessory protein NosD